MVTIEKPLAERNDKWKKEDAIAQKILVTSVDEKQLLHLLNCKTAFEMWMKIHVIFERDNEQQKCNLLQIFYGLTYEKGSDVATYISKLKNLAFRLTSMRTEINDDMIISKILATLPDEFGHFASAWDSTEKNNKTLENLTARLIAEEMRMKARQPEEKGVAFKTGGKKCNKCNKMGHFAKDCYSKINSGNKQIRCFRCNKTGHIEKYCKGKPQKKDQEGCSICKKTNHSDANCYFRKDKKEDKNKKKEDEKVSFLTTECEEDEVWTVDSGSTTNMTNDMNNMGNFKSTMSRIGVAKINESMIAKGVGSLEFEKCKLKEVVYIPDLATNLLSVSEITKNGGEVLFTADEVTISYKNKVILKGNKSKNGLYKINMRSLSENSSYLSESNKEAVSWHRKLGHIGNENLKLLLKISEGTTIPTT